MLPALWLLRYALPRATFFSVLDREVYDVLDPGYTGRCTAPLLVDKRARRIVCNESSVIVRALPLVVVVAAWCRMFC